MKTLQLFIFSILLLLVHSAGAQNNSLTFDGIDDHVIIPAKSSNDLSSGTIECILKPSVFDADGSCIMGVRGAGGTRYSFHIKSNSIGMYNGAYFWPLTYTFTAGVWYHLAFVCNGATSTMFYVNGTLIGDVGYLFGSATGQQMTIGAMKESGSAAEFFEGAIDEVRIWNTLLTAAQINENKDMSLSGTEAGLVALYTFNQGTASGTNTSQTTLLDKTAIPNNGTLNNFTLTGSSSNYTASSLSAGASTELSWLMGGNAGTTPTNNFIGTTDSRRLVFKTNNVERMSLSPIGNVGLGTSNASSILTIKQKTDGSAIDLQSPEGGYSNNYLKLGTNPLYPSINSMWSNARLDISAGSDLFLFGNNIYLAGNPVITRTGDPSSLATAKSSRAMPFEANVWNGSAGVFQYAGLQNVASTTTNMGHRLAFKVASTQTDLSDGTEVLSVLSNGTVGINTTDTKNYNLAVNGSAIFTKAVVKLYANWPDYVFHNSYRLPSLKETEAYITAHQHLQDIPSAENVEKNGIDLGANQVVLVEKVEQIMLYLIDMNKTILQQQKEIKALKKQVNGKH